jgi:hypothetical protein
MAVLLRTSPLWRTGRPACELRDVAPAARRPRAGLGNLGVGDARCGTSLFNLPHRAIERYILALLCRLTAAYVSGEWGVGHAVVCC